MFRSPIKLLSIAITIITHCLNESRKYPASLRTNSIVALHFTPVHCRVHEDSVVYYSNIQSSLGRRRTLEGTTKAPLP